MPQGGLVTAVIKETLVELLQGLPPWLAVFLLAAVPIVELRGAIPLGILHYNLPVHEAVFWSVLGNLVPVFFLLLFLGPVEKFLRRWKFFDVFFTRLFDRTLRTLDERVKRYEAFALTLFVGVPLPVTGAWTGSAAAHVFSLGYWRSFSCIAVGVLIAAVIVTFLTTGGQFLWFLGRS